MASVCVYLDVDQVEQEVKDELWVRHLYPWNELLKIVLYCVKHRLGHTSKYGRGGLPLRLAPVAQVNVTANTRTELKHENTPHCYPRLRQTRKHWLHQY